MPSCLATRLASHRSSNEQHRPLLRQSCIDRPTICSSRSFNKTAAVDESTPPLMATAIIELKTLENLFDSVRRKHAAMDFRSRQTAKGVRDLIFRDKPCLGNVHPNQHFRRIGTRCNGSAASLSFEFRVVDPAITDLHPQFHDVPANRVRYFGNGIGIGDFAHASRILKIIEQLFRISHLCDQDAFPSSQRRGGCAIKTCREATETAQTGRSDRRNCDFAELTTRRASFCKLSRHPSSARRGIHYPQTFL